MHNLNDKHLIRFLIFLILILAVAPPTLFAASPSTLICEHLLKSNINPFVILDRPNPGPLPEIQRESLVLEFCDRDCLRYLRTHDPFDTSPDFPDIPFQRRYFQRGPFVVNRDGHMIGEPVFRNTINRSLSQLTELERVYFAGHIVTSAQGHILSLDYGGGHVRQRPCSLKLLIDDLGGPQSMPDATIYLSDVPTKKAMHAYLPHLPVLDFYSLCLNPSDSGLDVLFRYLASPPDNSHNLSYREVLEPAAIQTLRIVEDASVIRKGININSYSERRQLIEKLSQWVIQAFQTSDKNKLRLVSAYKIMHPDRRLGDFKWDFEEEFYAAVFKAVPDFQDLILILP